MRGTIAIIIFAALAAGAVAQNESAAAGVRAAGEALRSNRPQQAIRILDRLDKGEMSENQKAWAEAKRTQAVSKLARTTKNATELTTWTATMQAKDLPRGLRELREIGVAIKSPKDWERVDEAMRASYRGRHGGALREQAEALIRAVPTDSPLQLSNRQNVFRRLALALRDNDWKTFDELAPVAVEHNYLHARYLLLVSEYARGNFARVIEIADEYNSTIAPDELSDGYHRESHLWADVYKWRSQKALGRLEDAAATAARVNAEWPNSAWAKAMR